LSIEEDLWLSVKTYNQWRTFFEKFLERTISILKSRNFVVSILLTNDQEIQIINKRYRKIDSPTNVLTFPQYSSNELLLLDVENAMLGDIVVSYQSVNKEASCYKKSFDDRVAHLFVHGVLHILGYDHMLHLDRLNMEALETQILQSLGVGDPYVL
jgi:probable rRNA maturation factor